MPTEDRSILDRSAPEPSRSWTYGPGLGQVADLYLSDGNAPSDRIEVAPTLVLIHGGFWRPAFDRVHLRPMAAALAAAGHPTVLVEYRRRPGRPEESLQDIRTAVGALGVEVDTSAGLVLVGHSAGGHLALVVAADAETPVTGCLALAPVADLVMADRLGLDGGAVRAYLGGPAQARGDLDPSRLPRPQVPVTVVHGARDSVVPTVVGQSYCDRRQIPMVSVPECGHFELIDPLSEHWRSVIAELSALPWRSGIE